MLWCKGTSLLFVMLVFISYNVSKAQGLDTLGVSKYRGIKTVVLEDATLYEDSNIASENIGMVQKGDSLLVYEVVEGGGFDGYMFGVAKKSKGEVGYIFASTAKLDADDVPEELYGGSGDSERVVDKSGDGRKGYSPEAYSSRNLDPATARILSVVIVGGGHFYAGETGTGFFLLGSSAVASFAGAKLTISSIETSCDGLDCNTEANYAPAFLGGMYAVGAWIYGIVQADDVVRRANRYNVSSTYSELNNGPGIQLSVRF